jgi:ferredoxin-NADP reductase
MSQTLRQGRPESPEPGSRVFDNRLLVRVLGVQREADGVVSIELSSVDEASLPAWAPGAHIDVILPDGLVRQYSLCGRPDDRTRWKIGVLLEPEGRGGSSFIHRHVRASDALEVVGPRNNFALGDAEEYLFIAGGIGITPILPMVRHVAASRRRWKLLYGGRTRGSMAFLDELAALNGDIQILPQDQHGHPDLPDFIGAYRHGVAVHCCGPGAMIDAVEAACGTWPASAIHRERFAASAKPSAVDDEAFEVELARSGAGSRITVPGDRNLLEILEEAGCQIDSSCRAGICGTCVVRVLAGIPQHNDDILDDEQRSSGTLILPCVSRCSSKLLVLDL